MKNQVLCVPHLRIEGLMTMAPLTEYTALIRQVFRNLRVMRMHRGLKDLFMGMSHDFEIAIEEGATFVRVGNAIFQD